MKAGKVIEGKSMRAEQEMLELILERARRDDRIRAVILNGSRASASAVHDRYSDYDVIYVVERIREFTGDKEWIRYFGDILIMQLPQDWYSHPYDYTGDDSFVYLMQFTDGTRIDLTLVDRKHIDELDPQEPRIILLDKDQDPQLVDVVSEKAFYIEAPSAKEFADCCNEFWWLSIYVAKGLCRKEFLYAKTYLEHDQMEMLVKMLRWRIGIEQGSSRILGKYSKYLKRYLPAAEMERFMQLFPNGDYTEIWKKLWEVLDFFEETALLVAHSCDYAYDCIATAQIRHHIYGMEQENKS